ncbi:MAG: putative quinol monooxygenase [Sporichthyaceae bacterium]
MIVVAGWIEVAATERDAYLEGCSVVMAAAAAAPGCLDFVLSADPLRPDRIRIFERWESDAHLDLFRGSGPPAEQQAQILDASVARYRIAAVEDA